MKNASTIFSTTQWGGDWEVLLNAWMKYEQGQDLSDDHKLGTASHPLCIAVWIACAWSAMWWLAIQDVDSLEEDFWCWWRGIQLAWRKDKFQ